MHRFLYRAEDGRHVESIQTQIHQLRPAQSVHLRRRLPELFEIERAFEKLSPWARFKTLAEVDCQGLRLPIHAAILGPENPSLPTLGIFAGVHGLERIGTHLAVSYINTLAALLSWDELTHEYLRRARLIFVPLINPGGMFLKRRANPQGVDLMRNAPVEAEDLALFRPLSGHRISPRLPWFRGVKNAPMEKEAAAVCELMYEELFPATVLVTLDIHSGFGLRDRLWFPYAKSKRPISSLAEIYGLVSLLEETYTHNVYKIEPQSQSYTTHGDLWDYLYDEHESRRGSDSLYVPLSLELGSWNWVKKNPRQIFSMLGAFNPMVRHRHQRTMRRHLGLFEFLMRAVMAYPQWAFPSPAEKKRLRSDALDEWYTDLEVYP